MSASALLLALALGAGALGGYPRPAGGPISQSAIGVQLDGAPAVVVVAGDRLVAFGADGGQVRGFPLALGTDEVAAGAPAAGDLDGAGRPALAVATLSGKLLLFSGGTPVPGFPVKLGAKVRAGPSFADVDGDGRPEVLVGDARGRLHAFKKGGREAAGWPIDLGAAVTSSASVSRFAGGPALAVGCADGKVHVLDLATRRERPGFPLQTGFEVTGAPAFADLDGDGAMDLVVGSQDFKLYAVDEKGQALPGFPVEAGYRIYEGPALADLEGDGRMEVAFTSADGFLHLVDARGAEVKGFPVKLGGRVFGGPVIGDVDRDGQPDLVAVSTDGNVVAVTREGRFLAGFPTRFDATDLGATPLLLDLAGDQSLSIFVGFPGGDLHAVRALRFGTQAATAPWPGAGHDAARSGRHGPNPPRYHALALAPAAPRTGDGLTASWRYVALDARPGEAEPAPQVDWYRNGAVVPDLHGQRTVPPRRAHKGEVWRFALTQPHGAMVFRSPEARILDTPPGPAEAAFDPPRPALGTDVKLVLTRPAPDADGDAVTYRYEWLLDGLPTGVRGPVFPGDRLKKGLLLTARVVAADGEEEGEPATVEARVSGRAPGAVAVALEPAAPRRPDALLAKVSEPQPGSEGIVYHYRWKVDGEARNLQLATPRLAAGSLRKHQKVTVEARAFDGEVEGPAAVAEATVANSPPGPPRVEIRPAAPRKGDALRAVLTAEALDADGDPLTYRFAWKKNGKPLATAGDPREVPPGEVARGDRFELEAWATDGEAEGPHAQAAVQVGNTPPTAPRVALRPERPLGGAPLEAVVLQPSADADGDPVSYAFAWTADDRPLTQAGGAALAPTQFHKHQRVRVTVTPSDGRDPGAPGVAEVTVEDAPPGAPQVALGPAHPTVATPLVVRVTAPAPDADADPIVYRYRWLRDGFAVPVSDGGLESRREPYWTSATELPAAELKKGQRWTVEVQAFDGELYGPVARAEVVVANTPPPPPRVALQPAAPRRVDGLRLALTQSPDADGDLVTYRHTWWRDGRKLDWPAEQAEVPRGVPRKGERWKVEVVASDGEAEAPPASAEVVIGNSPPGPLAIALCDRPVPAQTPIEAKVREPARDPDGDELVYRYDWTVNGHPLAAGRGHARLGPTALKKHDLARVVVTAFDGADAGPESAAECLVENTPPTRPEIELEPREPTALTGLRVLVRQPATDRDGDPIAYHYTWTRDGLPAPVQGPEVKAGALRHGETWRVVVRAFDGEEEGEPVTASAVVRNTPPPAPAVAIRPVSPVTGEALTCQATAPATDADQEPLVISYRWLRDGAPVALGEGQALLPAGVARRGERWRCEAWTSDGTAESPRARSEVAVWNSPPGTPVVVVEPDAPRRDDALTCRIAAEASDPDGDRLVYRYAWTKDGAPAPAGPDPTRVAPERLAKGQRWRCAVTAFDGELEGKAAHAEKTILDSPPGPARVRIAPAAPRPGQALRCEIVGKSEDPDGDPIRYQFTWERNGQPQPFSGASEEVPVRLVQAGDRWRCVVTPSDGELTGPSSGSPEVLVRPGEALPVSQRGP